MELYHALDRYRFILIEVILEAHLLSKLLENPVLSIATTLTALLTVLNNFIGSFGISPFWSDLFATVIIAYTIIHWTVFILRGVKIKEKVMILNGTTEERISLRALLRNIGPSIVILPVLVLLLVWVSKPLLGHIGHTNWTLCGSFIGNCNQRPCLELSDSKGRRIFDKCFLTDDDSGYKYLAAPNWRSYRPQKVALRCDGNISEAVELSQSFFDDTCAGIVNAR